MRVEEVWTFDWYVLFSKQKKTTNLGTGGAGTNGVISYGAPNSFQQFYSPSFGQYGIFAASTAPSASGGTPQVNTIHPWYDVIWVS